MAESVADDTVDYEAAPAAGDDDSDSCDEFGLPPLDAYWSSMLNVSKVGDPLPPPKPGTTNGGSAGSGRGKGKNGGRDRNGAAPYSAYRQGGGGGSNSRGGGWKGGGWKGRGKGNFRRGDDVLDFVAWAKDPGAEDGSRPPPSDDRPRARSRSPRRGGQPVGPAGGKGARLPAGTAPATDGKRLQDFMSWAKDKSEAKMEPSSDEEADEPVAGQISKFMAWATTEPSLDRKEEPKEDEYERDFRQRSRDEDDDEDEERGRRATDTEEVSREGTLLATVADAVGDEAAAGTTVKVEEFARMDELVKDVTQRWTQPVKDS